MKEVAAASPSTPAAKRTRTERWIEGISVFLATALFFLAISTSLTWFWTKASLTGIAGTMVIVALIYMSTLEFAG